MENGSKLALGGISFLSILTVIGFLADSVSLIEKLIERNKEAISIEDPTKRKMALADIFDDYHDAVAGEWEVSYELVKNRIYGEEHQEAFRVLKEATVLAIDKGESKKMLRRIKADKDGVLWKLSHGHSKQWNPIIETLTNYGSDHH